MSTLYVALAGTWGAQDALLLVTGLQATVMAVGAVAARRLPDPRG
ncbi:hypothetical protein [Amycolatopsis methanolica]|uniref:Uncharacterized protein n=1 Tax=Amycolatopsis methanolica 239 TaxID=1068978 RepID=A0A076MHM7_AMYME|nr:hypothetical protein [Amycolatopsis methanolica]AIJ20214.1 hypothetical protein AMETH_0122 [Amycolatopsis methanolica 239]